MMFRPADYKRRESSCINPCINETKSLCVYVPAENRHRCICPPPLCGPDCSGPCENGGAYVLDVCECAMGFEGPLCNDAVQEVEEAEVTTSIEEVEETTSIGEVEETTSIEEVEETPSIEVVTDEIKSTEAVQATSRAEYVQEITLDIGVIGGALLVVLAVAGLAVFFVVNRIRNRRAETAAAAEERRAQIPARETNDDDGVGRWL